MHHDFITCGGYVSDEGYTDKCFKLGSEEPFATMMTKRGYAASIILEPEKLWILGGIDGSSRLSSTEYIYADGRNEEGPPMPIALSHHAIVKINDTTSLLVGGYTGSVLVMWVEGGERSEPTDQKTVKKSLQKICQKIMSKKKK